MKIATKIVHAAHVNDFATGAINMPVYQTSTYVQDAPGKHKGYAYARGQNPSREALERNIAVLENGKFGLCFASGMAAIDAVMRLLKPGDEVITTRDLYGGSYRLFSRIFEEIGVVIRYTSFYDASNVKNLLTGKTKLIWVESPTNPLMSIADIKALSEISKSSNAFLAVDNTFATPYLQNPLDLGTDIVVHSATKYLGGHSDCISGALVVNNESLYERLKFIQNTCGAIPGPQDCFLVLRGIKTLFLRMKQSCESAQTVAEYLDSHALVDRVYYPGLKRHAGHKLASEQMRDFGAMVAFDLKEDTQEDAVQIMNQMKLFTIAESLGGVESLCGHPATMSHGSMTKQERLGVGIKDSMIRLSIGIEDKDDLIADLKQALS